MPQKFNRRKKPLTQMRIVSVGMLSIALTTLGLIMLIRLVSMSLERQMKEEVGFSVEMPETFTREHFVAISPELNKLKGIKRIEYISPDSALRMLEQELGENPLELLGYNPLSPVIRLELRDTYLHQDSLKALERQLGRLGVGSKLSYEEEQLTRMDKNIASLQWVLWGLVLLQAVFALIQINNTVRMTVYAERMQIRTLTLVGASAWFIRRPIVWRSLIDGFVAACLSLALIGGGIYALEMKLGLQVLTLIGIEGILLVSLLLIIVAITTATIASIASTGRYINMDGRHIHLV